METPGAFNLEQTRSAMSRRWRLTRDIFKSLAMDPEKRAECVEERERIFKAFREGQNGGKTMSTMGDESMYTLGQIRKRKALRNAPLVVEQLEEMWNLIPGSWDRTSPDASLPLEAYIEFNSRLYKALISPLTQTGGAGTTMEEEAELERKTAVADWEHDTRHTGGRMTKQTFSDSVFELVDVWSETTDETEYAALMWRLSRAVMDNADKPNAVVTWKRGDEVQSIVESETKKLIKQFKKRPPIVAHNPMPDFNLLDMFPIQPEIEAPKQPDRARPSSLYQGLITGSGKIRYTQTLTPSKESKKEPIADRHYQYVHGPHHDPNAYRRPKGGPGFGALTISPVKGDVADHTLHRVSVEFGEGAHHVGYNGDDYSRGDYARGGNGSQRLRGRTRPRTCPAGTRSLPQAQAVTGYAQTFQHAIPNEGGGVDPEETRDYITTTTTRWEPAQALAQMSPRPPSSRARTVRSNPTREPGIASVHVYQLSEELDCRGDEQRAIKQDPDHDQCGLGQMYPLHGEAEPRLMASDRTPTCRTSITHGVAIPTNPPPISVVAVPDLLPPSSTMAAPQRAATSPTTVFTLKMTIPTATPKQPTPPTVKVLKRRPSRTHTAPGRTGTAAKIRTADASAEAPVQKSKEEGGSEGIGASPAHQTLTHGFGVAGDPRPSRAASHPTEPPTKQGRRRTRTPRTTERTLTTIEAPAASLDVRTPAFLRSIGGPGVVVPERRRRDHGRSNQFHAGIFGRGSASGPNAPVSRSSNQQASQRWPAPPPAPPARPPVSGAARRSPSRSPRSFRSTQSPRSPHSANSSAGGVRIRTRKRVALARYGDFRRALRGRLSEREIRCLWVAYCSS